MTLHIKHYKAPHFLRIIAFPALLAMTLPAHTIAATYNDSDGVDPVKKQKLINKTYDVTTSDQLKIDNRFGDVVVSTWNKNQITVDIELEGSAVTAEEAQQILDRLSVQDERNGNVISFKTIIGEIHTHQHDQDGNTTTNNNDNADGDRGNRDRDKERAERDKDRADRDKTRADRDKRDRHSSTHFHINYVIHMPPVNRLTIRNEFGKIQVPDFEGLVSLFSKFGGLTAGKLNNVDVLHVEFGEANVADINNGKVVLNYNKRSRIDNLGGSVNVTSGFSHNVQIKVDNSVQDLNISESYSDIRLAVDTHISAQFDIHTNFGSLHNESGLDIKEEKEDSLGFSPHFDKDYNGKIGNGNGKIRIRSSFGKILLSDHLGDKNPGDKKGKADRTAVSL